MQKKNPIRIKAACGLAVVSVCGIIFLFAGASGSAKAMQSEIIADNITIAGVDVSGMTRNQAKEALASYIDSHTDVTFTLQANEAEVSCTNKDLKITSNEEKAIDEALHYGSSGNLIARFLAQQKKERGEKEDIPLTFSANRLAITEFVKKSKETLDVKAVDNSLIRKNGAFEFIDGKEGMVISLQDSVDVIANYIQEEWDGADAAISLVTKTEEPKGDKEMLSSIKDPIGTFSTAYNSSASGRRINVENGASKLNGWVVYPGETFSVAEHLSPISEENGYATGSAYENGRVVDSVGGGVCQIATTLYNALIRAEIKITERSPHSMTVSYVEPSMDAAIAGDYKDLKFKNNQDTPIYLDVITDGSSITATIFGKETRPANRKIDFVSEVVEEIEPGVVYKAAPDQPIGYQSRTQSPETGYEAHLLKIVTVDGVEESNQIFNRSSYKPRNAIIMIGTLSDDSDASGAVRYAISTQDPAQIAMAIGHPVAGSSAGNSEAAEDAAEDLEAEEETETENTEQQDAEVEQQETDPSNQIVVFE